MVDVMVHLSQTMFSGFEMNKNRIIYLEGRILYTFFYIVNKIFRWPECCESHNKENYLKKEKNHRSYRPSWLFDFEKKISKILNVFQFRIY